MSSQDYEEGAILTGRNAAPSHYLFKFESYSLLSKASIKKYSDSFEAGGYKWNLSIYLTGDESMNVTDHISIYLQLEDTKSLPTGWEVNVIINFFIFNQLQDKYFGLQDGKVKHLHSMKTNWGINKFIDLETFSDPLNGYLVDDACVFGAEVFVVKNSFKGERLSMMNDPPTYYHTWKVCNFQDMHKESYKSESFGCYNWNVSLYPKGIVEGEGNSISVFLDVSRLSFPSNTKLLTKYTLRVKDQMNGEHIELTADQLYTHSNTAWGRQKFMSLAKLKDPKNGYLVHDTCIIEAEVTLLGVVLTLE